MRVRSLQHLGSSVLLIGLASASSCVPTPTPPAAADASVAPPSSQGSVDAGIMTQELGLDSHVATRAAVLHDVGKAVDRELQGTHLELGLELLRKHGESKPVVDAVAAHHLDIDWPSLEAMIVQELPTGS